MDGLTKYFKDFYTDRVEERLKHLKPHAYNLYLRLAQYLLVDTIQEKWNSSDPCGPYLQKVFNEALAVSVEKCDARSHQVHIALKYKIWI